MAIGASTFQAIVKVAAGRGWEPAALAAVVEVESAGIVFAAVDGRNEPVIRFEGHYFDRRLSGDDLARARKLGLASPTAGAVKNPSSQTTRWRLLNSAAAISAQAAFESTSWGVGQVMGAHWQWLGFTSVTALVNLCRSGVEGQIELMARFIEKAGLADELKRRDWAGFARGYNGPGFAKNRYDKKMAEAYARWAKKAGSATRSQAETDDAAAIATMLRLGSKGAEVRELQTLLARAKFYAGKVDGDFGPATRDAVNAFQQANGLKVDGFAGPKTRAALDRFRQSPGETPGQRDFWTWLADVIEALF